MPRHEVVIIPKGYEEKSPVEMSNSAPPTEPTSQQKSEAQGKKDVLAALAVNVGKRIAVGVIDRIGSATGDYTINSKIRNFTNIATYAGYIAINPIAGGIYTAIDVGSKVFDYSLSIDKANKENALYREQSGLSTAKGSRIGGRKI